MYWQPEGSEERGDFHRWFVLHVKPRTEKKVDGFLRLLNARFHYLPLVKRVRKVQRRRVVTYVPVFPGYVFAFLDHDRRLRLLETGAVVQSIVVDYPRKLVHQLRQVERAGNAAADLTLVERFSVGDLVKVIAGPCRGVEGRVKRVGNVTKLVLEIDMIGQAVEFTISPVDLEKIDEGC